MNNLVFLAANQIAKAIRNREVSSREVVEAYLSQNAQHNQKLNAIITLDAESVFEQSQAADQALAKGEIWGALHGVPITIKDSLETKGLRTTCSHSPLFNYVPQQDATVVARLRAAGAIILGKTNTPKLAEDFQTNSPLFGRTNNPWNLDCTPGGSTGGGAAAIAAGLSPLELGSDIGGSIRIPSHFCGVFGFKPTEFLVPTFGHIPELPNHPKTIRHLQTIGPLARSVADLKLCFSLIAGSNADQPEVRFLPAMLDPITALRSCRFAWTEGFGTIPVDTETKAAIGRLASSLVNLGCCVEHHNTPPNFDTQVSREAYVTIYAIESGSPSSLSQAERQQRQQQYFKALVKRDTLASSLDNFLSHWDAWLVPVVSVPAFTHCPPDTPIQVDAQEFPYSITLGAYTTIFNLTGNPAVVLPLTRSKSGLPIGIQLVGQRGSDMKLLEVAERLTQITGLFQPPPGY